MKASRKRPALKPKAVSNFRDKIEVQKRRLIYHLMELAPKSLPKEFCEYLKFVLRKVIVDGRYEHSFQARGFGFGNVHEFNDQMRLLKDAWKYQVVVSIKQPINSTYWCAMKYLPAK